MFTQATLDSLDNALNRFHEHRKIFQLVGVRDPTSAGLSLPCQHTLVHYHRHIKNFGAPNGLCSSITESKHISAVKRPWCRSNRYDVIHQIMQTNCRADKLSAARANFTASGILNLPTWQPRIPHPVLSDDDADQCGAAEGVIYNEVFLAVKHGTSGSYLYSERGTDYSINSSQLPAQYPGPQSQDWPPEPPRPSQKIPLQASPPQHQPRNQPITNTPSPRQRIVRRPHQSIPLSVCNPLHTVKPINNYWDVPRNHPGDTFLESRRNCQALIQLHPCFKQDSL